MKRKSIANFIVAAAVILIVCVFCVLTIRNFQNSEKTEIPESITSQIQKSNIDAAKNTHLFFGNPSKADSQTENNFLLVNQFYVSSYNRERATPNWTAWKLTRADIGKIERQNDFRPDDRLPNGWTKITPSDYFDKIYDRGHMCPSGDRTSSIEANSSTFLMTNQTPQHSDLNQGPWEKLESFCRGLIFKGNTLYIYAGNYGDRGLLRRRVTIPTNFWKIIVIIPKGMKAENFSENTKVIAVDMPNIEGIKEDEWQKYSTTVREIEGKTGLDFFASFPKVVQDSIETKFPEQKSPN
jgi:endonuclease G, mitochondrial